MRVFSTTFILVILSLVANSSSLRNDTYYAFISYRPTGIHRQQGVLTNSNSSIWPSIYTARDKLIENKKYTIPIFTAVFAGIFTKVAKITWDFISKSKANCNRDSGKLNTYRCTKCNYTIYPAKNRDGRFVGEKFSCPSCSAPFSSFMTNRN